ncbi:MAG TPA: isoleucine--tRNA ligase [Patescibacteria group bacterium]|nr:isoleucine--tRNA ligase [Patescibacteria group bacterium]
MSDEKEPQEREPLFPKMEEEISAYWKKHHIFERSIEERPEKKTFVFYDGPPFATGLPHYGHLLQSAIKDAVPRYWTMKGYRVPRRWGWDCHGLPVENLIEKELKLGSKKEIEAYGIDKFNNACRLSVMQYEAEWGRYIDRIGRWVDFENSYKTMDNDYIESVWWVFGELYKQALVYKGRRVSLYCPRCSTPLSNFEIAMGNSYIDKDDPAIYIKFPVKGKEKTYFLAWTTTPWTLPGNTALTVHPELMYVAAKIHETGETLIFAESRQSEILKQYYPLPSSGVGFEIVQRWTGNELVGMRYEPLYVFEPVTGDGFRVVAGEHVSKDDGTGIVHTAPAFGEEDFAMGNQYKLPLIDMVDEEGKLNASCGLFAGLKTQEANRPIIDDLQARGLLYREETITHSVPVCWRCHTLLLYKAQPAWFVDVTKLKPKMLKTAEKINWRPEHLKEGRFGKGLLTAPDWNISRTRYWGSPLPVWECAACYTRTVIHSAAELKKLAKKETLPEPFDLHRPFIDQVLIPCACGKDQHRVPEVFDCWFESGSMPVASFHYPFQNKKSFDDHFPADFIGEAQDQTRGWFYTLHVIASALFKKPAAKNVIVTGMILAEDGKKMSKSLKNYPDPWEVLTRYGGDALRYYLLSSPVIDADSLNFSERDLQNVVRGFLNTLWNVKAFYATYAQEEVKPSKPRSAHILDRWIAARFMHLLREVTKNLDQYELAKAARPLRDFVDDVSTWWLRRSRDRLKSDNEFERNDALKTLREILEELAKTMAPFMPFIAEKIYLDIGGAKASVHLEKWPEINDRLIDDHLLQDMMWVRLVCSKGHEERVKSKMPVRQALASVKISLKDPKEVQRLQKQPDLLGLIREELNVESVILESKLDLEEPWAVSLDTDLTPELREKGWRREFVRQVMNLRKEAGLAPQDRVHVFYQAPEEITQAIARGLDEMKKDLRTDELVFVEQAPQAAKASSVAKVNGRPLQIWFV